jgi:hypothetical protein
MTNQHPITPPLELVQQWDGHGKSRSNAAQILATAAARWGADQELDACCVEVAWLESSEVAKRMRERRRPKPPSLKKQALEELAYLEQGVGGLDLIRRAIEALPND